LKPNRSKRFVLGETNRVVLAIKEVTNVQNCAIIGALSTKLHILRIGRICCVSPQPITQNTLFYGDNLKILREYIPSESVDLIYLDPPFNSSRNYNVLFKDESGIDSEAQITAFEDTWHWNPVAEQTYYELITDAPDRVSKLIISLRDFVGANQMMAYLVMMTIRLVELHRILKPTGSLYLHCDPTASHYLKVILDTIFKPQNFRNEVI